MTTPPATAALLVIGDEILSGRTKDRNIGFVAATLTEIGIDLEEVRIVGDRMAAIVRALRELAARHDWLLTTGGIGPTHDDITAEAVAEAFGAPLVVDPRALAALEAHYRQSGTAMNAARARMARIPQGAELIPNPISAAPGFRLGKVFVMAGVPAIMQAMMDHVAACLPAAAPILSETIEAGRPEGDVALLLAALQEEHPAVRMGSYPYHDGGRYTTRLVLRSRDGAALTAAAAALRRRLESA